jgi:act minimal PKS chain-length factor (CLF/KS beta)
MRGALADARSEPAQVGLVAAAAMSHPLHDLLEARAIGEVFAGAPPPVAALSSRVGVCAATAPLAVCATLLGMTAGLVPGGVGYRRPDPACDVPVAHGPWQPGAVSAALVNASSLGGGNYSMVIGRA